MKDMIEKMVGKGAWTFCLLAVLALAACASPPRSIEVPEQSGDYVLGVGDVLRINVYGQAELSGEYKVDAKGDIAFPLINDVEAAGFTTSELAGAITDRLDPAYIVDPRISVNVLNFRAIYVLGEVRSPGRYDYAPGMTALQAIASAGGYTYRGNEDSAELTRHVKGAIKTFTINQMTMIKPGDTIVVKRRWF